MNVETLSPGQVEARQRARTEIMANRDRIAREREARALAAETADEEIAREVRARRDDEAHQAEVRAERQRIYAIRDADLAAERERERQAQLVADPKLRIAETPARRLAKQLRARLGDEFDGFMAELTTTTVQQFLVELRRIPDDERAERITAERAAQAATRAAEAIVLPEPEDAAEVEILRANGLIDARRAAALLRRQTELNEGAL